MTNISASGCLINHTSTLLPRHRKCSFPARASYSTVNDVADTMSKHVGAEEDNLHTMDNKNKSSSSVSSPRKILRQPHKESSWDILSSGLSTINSTRLTTIYTSTLLAPASFTTKRYYFELIAHQISLATVALANLSVSSYSALLATKKIFSSLSRIQSLVTIFLVISLSLPRSNDALGFYKQSKCETHGWNAFPVWRYRAKPRWVPPLHTDRKMQREFLQLFRGGGGRGDSSSSEEDSYEDDFPLDIDELKRIADMCPKDAFFYSLSPKHLEATIAIARMIVAQPSPPEVLKLARALLRSRYVNPRVWYHGLISAAEERTDMTGFKIAHPVDAMPDLFVPGPMLFEVMDKYRTALEARSEHNGTIIQTIVHREKRASSSTRRFAKKQGKNETVADTFAKIEIGHVNAKNKVVKSGGNDRNSIHSQSFEESQPIDMSSLSKSKNKRKKISSKRKHAADIDDAFLKGNVTKYRADTGMWKRARIDAFDDCIVVDGSVGVRNGVENKLWYFREDMMVNQHHWYWHQEYPLNATRHRPRRAELFFYMHRNLIARYNAERISNGLPLVGTFDIRPGAEIQTQYDSLLADVNSGQFWTPRPHGVHLTDIIHELDPDFERNLYIWKYNELHGRLVRSIQVGHLLVGSIGTMKIRNTKGIEPLGNTVEASELSVNPFFYDAMGFHNLGHQLIGLSADPKWERRVPTGVMADTLTTMRDPEFYSYHTTVDNLFDLYKKTLPPYKPYAGEYPLRWDGVEIMDVEVVSRNGGKSSNQLRTFWANKRFELAPGVDQSIHKGDLEVDVCAVHLDHEPFDFKITVTLDPCAETKSNKGSVRIFLAPRYDEHGNRHSLKVQRRLMIHMDTFPVDLRVGRNVIYRRSYDSNVVRPWTKHIKDYANPPKHPQSEDFCGCGWPTHLYIPKGSPEGTAFDIFVMITNYDHDYVEEDPDDLSIPEPCNSPYLYCGVKWRQYPDAKPMGYPFDRLPFSVPIKCPIIGVAPLWSTLLCKFLQLFWYEPVRYLEEYVSYAPNMASAVVEITHLDRLVW